MEQQEELLRKIDQIEEHALAALAQFPELACERLKMIVALVRFMRTEVDYPRG